MYPLYLKQAVPHPPHLHAKSVFLSHPRVRYQATRNSLYALESTEIIQTSQFQAYLFFPTETTTKPLVNIFFSPSASWQNLVLPNVALHGVLYRLFLGIYGYKNFHLHDSYFCVCVSYHTPGTLKTRFLEIKPEKVETFLRL